MKTNLQRYKNFIVNLLVPAIVFGFVTGVSTAIVVTLFKFCAKHVIHYSELGYELIRERLYLLLVFLVNIGKYIANA